MAWTISSTPAVQRTDTGDGMSNVSGGTLLVQDTTPFLRLFGVSVPMYTTFGVGVLAANPPASASPHVPPGESSPNIGYIDSTSSSSSSFQFFVSGAPGEVKATSIPGKRKFAGTYYEVGYDAASHKASHTANLLQPMEADYKDPSICDLGGGPRSIDAPVSNPRSADSVGFPSVGLSLRHRRVLGSGR